MKPSTQGTLTNQVAIITGAGRGIGRSVARALSREGARVALLARSQEQINAATDEILAAGGAATALQADVTSEADVERAFARVGELWGEADILVNNAGIGAFGAFAEASPDDLDRVLATTVRGTFLCARQALKTMIPRRHGFHEN